MSKMQSSISLHSYMRKYRNLRTCPYHRMPSYKRAIECPTKLSLLFIGGKDCGHIHCNQKPHSRERRWAKVYTHSSQPKISPMGEVVGQRNNAPVGCRGNASVQIFLAVFLIAAAWKISKISKSAWIILVLDEHFIRLMNTSSAYHLCCIHFQLQTSCYATFISRLGATEILPCDYHMFCLGVNVCCMFSSWPGDRSMI